MADIAEEVARFYGYDNIPSTVFAGAATRGTFTEAQKFEQNLGVLCRAAGFDEIDTFSLINQRFYDKILLSADSPCRKSVVLANPLSEDLSILRTTSLPSMLDALSKNFSYRNPCCRFYEIATIYISKGTDENELPDERKILTIGSYGSGDFYTFKGALESILDRSLRRKSILSPKLIIPPIIRAAVPL